MGKNKGHPAVFPVELPAFFIKLLSRPGSLVIDPFGGSGSTGIAAINLGRDCVLIDNNAAYCRLALERWQQECTAKSAQISLRDAPENAVDHKKNFYNTSMQQCAAQIELMLNERHAPYGAIHPCVPPLPSTPISP